MEQQNNVEQTKDSKDSKEKKSIKPKLLIKCPICHKQMVKKGLNLHILRVHSMTRKASQAEANRDVNISINKEVSKMKETADIPFDTQRYIDQQFAAREKEKEEQREKKELHATITGLSEKMTEITNQQKNFCSLFPQMCTADEVKVLSEKVDRVLDATINTNRTFCEMYPELCKNTEINTQNITSLQKDISTLKDIITSSITPINEQIRNLKVQTDNLCALNPALCQQVEEIKSIIKPPECPACKKRQQEEEIKAAKDTVIEKLKEGAPKEQTNTDINNRLTEIRMLQEQRLLRRQQIDKQQIQKQPDTTHKPAEPKSQPKKKIGIFG